MFDEYNEEIVINRYTRPEGKGGKFSETLVSTTTLYVNRYEKSDVETTSSGKRNQIKIHTCYYRYINSDTFIVSSITDKAVYNGTEYSITEVLNFSNVETDLIDPHIKFSFEEV